MKNEQIERVKLAIELGTIETLVYNTAYDNSMWNRGLIKLNVKEHKDLLTAIDKAGYKDLFMNNTKTIIKKDL